MDLRPDELERYDRQIRIFGFGVEGQKKLKSAKVLVAGLGGLGCPAAMYLAAAGVGKLILVDKESVDLSNLNRQILHWTGDIGKLKVKSAAEKLRQLNPHVEIEELAIEINEDSIEGLIKEVDVVVDGMDNYKTRFIINEACVVHNKPFVHAAVYGFEGRLLTILPGKGPCLRCLVPSEPPEVRPLPVFGATPGVMAMLEVIETMKLVLDIGKPCSDKLIIFDGLTMTFYQVKVEASAQCPVCAKHK